MKDILVIKLGALGDVVMATALLRQVQAHHAGARTWLLTDSRFAPLFRNWPGLQVQDCERGGWRAALATICWIRRRRFGRIYDLQSSDRTAIYCALSGVPERIGNHARFPWTHHPGAPWRGEGHIQERMLEVLRSGGIPARDELPQLPAAAAEIAEVEKWIAGQGGAKTAFALLHAGASPRHPEKCWPGFAELAAALAGARVLPVWIGGDADAAANRRLAETAGADVTGQFTLPQLAALARHARFAVTNDSGPMHVLSCAGIPVYGLFGPTDWRRNHAIGQRQRVIAADRGAQFRPAPIGLVSCAEVLERLERDGLLA